MKLEHRQVDVGRLRLHVVEAGQGPPVLLLHGFPADWSDWTELMSALVNSGYRAIAPDLPGYGESGRLPRVDDYRMSALTADLAGLIVALGLERVHVIGHDWGGILAFSLAAEHPHLVARLIVINGPHPALMQRAIRHFEQARKSWYVFLFQLPWLPEWLVRTRAAMTLALRGMEARRGAFSDADIARYSAALRKPGVAHAALNYYRAAARIREGELRLVQPPTLVLWGDRDRALSARLLLDGLRRFVPDLRVVQFATGGHWLHHDLPEVVQQQALEFFAAETSPPK